MSEDPFGKLTVGTAREVLRNLPDSISHGQEEKTGIRGELKLVSLFWAFKTSQSQPLCLVEVTNYFFLTSPAQMNIFISSQTKKIFVCISPHGKYSLLLILLQMKSTILFQLYKMHFPFCYVVLRTVHRQWQKLRHFCCPV